MREPRNYLPRDLQALYYLNALEARDLESVAALWDEASRDPELEARMRELAKWRRRSAAPSPTARSSSSRA